MDWLLYPSLSHLVIFLFSIVIVRSFSRRHFSALSSIPGPFTASISRAWRIKEVYLGHVEETELKLHETHGMC